MNILVTGAAGFIGSHVCDYFVKQNHNVTGIDNFDNFYPKKFKISNLQNLEGNERFKFLEGDIRDKIILDKIFSSQDIDVVIHLAAKAGVRPSIESAAQYYDVNIIGTINLMESMKTYNVTRLIFGSSSSVYGNNDKLPFFGRR